MRRFRSFLPAAWPVVFFAACTPGGDQPSGAGGPPGSSGLPAACPACVTDQDCSAGWRCGQFGGDTFCAPDCAHTGCSSDRSCTPVTDAEGGQVMLCVPTTSVCGESPATQGSNLQGSGGGGGGSSGETCGSLMGPDVPSCCIDCQAEGQT